MQAEDAAELAAQVKVALRPSYKSGALSREEFKVAARRVTEAAFAQFGDGPPPPPAEVSAAIESLVRESVGSHV